MAQKLISDWLKVATSGKTVDGREITETEITQMAASYDKEEYTSNIWYEHIRYFGNLGQVIEAKAEKDKKDRLCLFVKLTPSNELISLNSQGQKLFTSVEIHPNFCDSGEAYLVGLGVTDEPASVGTTQLHFSSRKQSKDNYFADLEELGVISFNSKESFISQVVNKFKDTSKDNEQENDTMSKELLQEIVNTLNTQSQKIETFSTRLDAFESTRKDKENDDAGGDNDTDSNTAEMDELRNQFSTMNQSLSDLTKKFNASLKQEFESTGFEDETGGDDEESYI